MLYKNRLTPRKSPSMTASRGIEKPLISEEKLAAVIDFHSGAFNFTTRAKDISSASTNESSS